MSGSDDILKENNRHIEGKLTVVPDLKPPSQKVAQLAWATCASLHEVRDFLAS
jgi:hypothetical protein